MLELYLDTVDVEHVARFNACLPIRGVTTNPSILAKSGRGLKHALAELAGIIGPEARFHAQVVSRTVEDMVEEAKHIHALPYDMVVKVPATEIGLAAIKKMKAENIQVLAQMFAHPAVQPEVDQFIHDWQGVFGSKLSFES